MLPGSSLFWESAFAFADVPVVQAADDIAFDGYGLQNASITVSEANFEDSGESEFNGFPQPRRNGSGFLSRYWRGKPITVSGTVRGSTKAALEAKIDDMKRALSKKRKTLQYRNALGIRKMTATLKSASFPRKAGHITTCPFSLVFEAEDAFWYDDHSESFNVEAVATLPHVESFTNSGSAEADPFLVVVFDSVSGTTEISVTANGRQLTVAGAFATGTVVEMDGRTKRVRVNGAATDYSGTFPELLPGPNSVTFDMDGTAVVDIIAAWRKNYL